MNETLNQFERWYLIRTMRVRCRPSCCVLEADQLCDLYDEVGEGSQCSDEPLFSPQKIHSEGLNKRRESPLVVVFAKVCSKEATGWCRGRPLGALHPEVVKQSHERPWPTALGTSSGLPLYSGDVHYSNLRHTSLITWATTSRSSCRAPLTWPTQDTGAGLSSDARTKSTSLPLWVKKKK